MPFSHHSHSGQFCRHAKGDLEDVIKSAIDKNFRLFGLSEHAPRYRKQDLYPEESDLKPEDTMSIFEDYLSHAHKLRENYKNSIDLLVGLETDYVTEQDLIGTEDLIARYENTSTPIEYIVGSVHHAFETPIDFDKQTFDSALETAATRKSLYSEYYSRLLHLVKTLEPEVVGHIDLIRLYEPNVALKDYPDAWKLIEDIVKHVASYGGLIEVNAAAIRKGWVVPYPASDILSIIRNNGARLTLSDDTHTPENVGLNYWRVFEYLKSHDVTDIYYLERCEKGTPSAGRRGRTIAKKYEGKWSTDVFWSTCNPSWK
ncbi:histidinol phosphate phosphatase H [Wallemia mellicola]|uniref:Histidinol-phosphatase n=1 Tax=Wallemia mellicola TaxID=1708541 RepID=A0A4T0S7A0_9BASI|nr:hypothetical protein E3Q24_02499 [Wallemia mellicola]TIB74924.1 hypothetical protein E3Q23_02525 [Wallemia mellicola]TIB86476.1 histidinol phosphate phosphatase H [Wallemia mellicola]TIB89435.1 histidinol phosphate phosphatase H [Wallemia mellicola]TIB97215.1 histidinol phosphate phosphatase H [Wallemia mellicola]